MAKYWHQPDIDPVLLKLWGPLQIRWYSLLYVGGFVVGRWVLKRLAKEEKFQFTEDHVEQLILWLLLGTVIGARVVYCVVYDPWALMANPLYLFEVYRGGLSFHGGFLGCAVAAYFFCRKYSLPFWNVTDAMAIACTPGLAMGRIGNFINGELYGRVSYVPWAVVFKTGGPEPRHPSQLYEGFLEGVVLFGVLWLMRNRTRRDGTLSLMFLFGYTAARFIVEFFRQPDAHLGFLLLGLSMGQWLSVVMLASGFVLLYFRFFRPEAAGVPDTGTTHNPNRDKRKRRKEKGRS